MNLHDYLQTLELLIKYPASYDEMRSSIFKNVQLRIPGFSIFSPYKPIFMHKFDIVLLWLTQNSRKNRLLRPNEKIETSFEPGESCRKIRKLWNWEFQDENTSETSFLENISILAYLRYFCSGQTWSPQFLESTWLFHDSFKTS